MALESGFPDKTTSELISVLQNGDEPQDAQKMAFAVLCTRFRKNLLEKCEIVCKRYGHGPVVAEQITERTFQKYIAKPNFQLGKSKTKDADTGFILYLFGIAKRELTNFYREEKRRLAGLDGTDRIILDLPDLPIERLDREMQAKHKAIRALPEKHRAIYLTYEYYDRRGLNPPNKLKKELREYLQIEQTTVRGYKKEAIKIVDACMDAVKNQSDETR